MSKYGRHEARPGAIVTELLRLSHDLQEAHRRIDRLTEIIEEDNYNSLLMALMVLYDETADYIKINNLGDIHHNKSMRDARDAIAGAKKI